MTNSMENNNEVVQEITPSRRPSILLSEEVLPELEKGALALGFARPIKEPAPISSHVIKAAQQIKPEYTAEVIAVRVQEIASSISTTYLSNRRQLVIIGVLKGCSPFISDLLRAMDQRVLMEVDFMEINLNESYLESEQQKSIRLPQTDIEGKDILIVDDILDTGSTISRIIKKLYKYNPRTIDACVLIAKTARRCAPIPELKYTGFKLKSGWAVGYGMDYKQYYRNLPYIGLLKKPVE